MRVKQHSRWKSNSHHREHGEIKMKFKPHEESLLCSVYHFRAHVRYMHVLLIFEITIPDCSPIEEDA